MKTEINKQPLDAAFQYYVGSKCIKDTGLITLKDARKMWKDNLDGFKAESIRELSGAYSDTVEMCIWCNMDSVSDYVDQDKYAASSDMRVIDGELYNCTPFFG